MGKKGSWFSAIKRVFTPNSKEKPVANGSEKKSTKEKKKGRGILRNGETKSFIPLFREPSSIEKILGEADQQKLFSRPPTPIDQPITPPLVATPRVASPRVTSPKAASPRVAASPKAASSRAFHRNKEVSYRPEPTLRYRNVSATKIQAAYRGYMARRSFKALRGLVRLQGVVRGQNVRRQTMNSLKKMQLLVRVQNQIQSCRINQVLQRQAAYKNDKELESTLGKWTATQSEAGLLEDWDDSVLTKEEIEARQQRKVEAIIKRERIMAYSYSHQLWTANPKSAQTSIMNVQSGGFPWQWSWLDRQLPAANPPPSQTTNSFLLITPPTKSFLLTPPRPKQSPGTAFSNYKQHNTGFDNLDSITPRSTRSSVPMRTKYQYYTPSNRTPTNSSLMTKKYSKTRSGSAFDHHLPLKDDDSLMSCPPFSVPNYMTPTVSAKAKSRESTDSNSKKMFSFPGSFKWNKGSGNKDSISPRIFFEKHKSFQSVGDVSIDSAISMPAAVGRKPFNRFV